MKSLEVVYKITDSTEEEKISYTRRIRRILRKKKGLMTIHSHPSSFLPSIEDFNSSYANGYGAEMVLSIAVLSAESWITLLIKEVKLW